MMTTSTTTSPAHAVRRETTIADALRQEFEHELTTTRRFLDRLPANSLTWKPHEKSLTAGQLALHIAGVPGAVLEMASRDRAEVPRVGFVQPNSLDEIRAALNASADTVHALLPSITDERMHEPFSLTRDDEVLLTMPRSVFLRSIMLNHWYHHRGQFGVYLRLLGVSVPSSYGPSGDESPFCDHA